MALIDDEDRKALTAPVRRLVADGSPLSRVRQMITLPGGQTYQRARLADRLGL
ncbi:hypothetical protein [Actinomadura madurae]|uniref:hypothetical protein n=1 Tax=Actinomadura madurae TaxID=1993 RepID=UPI000D906B30|nr:hypothetical protein [Actinomadura madurae]SPT50145.1 Uncharacterised protein [Actinomadura madurae]